MIPVRGGGWLRISAACVGLLAPGLVFAGGLRPLTAQDSLEMARLLRGRVESLREGLEVTAGGDPLLARRAIPDLYETRGFRPAWVGDLEGPDRVDELLRSLTASRLHGLDPSDYHLRALDSLRMRAFRSGAPPTERVELELLASDAFLVLGSHLLMGRVNPETIDPEWLANRRNQRLDTVLEAAVESGRIRAHLDGLAPAQPRYGALMAELGRLRAIESSGGWPVVEPGPTLEPGARDPRVEALRARLLADDDGASDPELFDDDLAEAVRRFQARHGLEADGVVGPATLRELDVSAGDRARQVEINLERWRWLPDDLGPRHIEVNIAGFDVRVVEDGRTVRRHRAVVGRQYRQTPMFSGRVTYLVFSPYWHVPPTIAAVDKLPLIKADPSYLTAQRMTLLSQGSGNPVDPSTVDWTSMTGSEFNRRYRLRQDPGPGNALGRVKFMFPNRHNVYLHDTPSRELFARASRSFSSGCIRIQDPLDLAEYLLADQPEWTRQRIDQAATAGEERTVLLSEPIPIHLLYWSAWADEEGVIHFRDDIYGRDRTVDAALAADPPGA